MNWGNCVVKGVATVQCIPVLFANVLNVLFMFAGTVAVFMIIISGFRFILSSGDAKQLDGAKKTLTLAVIGLIIILLSYLILSVLAKVTGVSCLLVFGPFAAGSCAK